MSQAKKTPSIFIPFMIIACFSLIEIAILLFFPIENKVEAHLFTSVALFTLIVYMAKYTFDLRFLLVFGLFTITLGPLGAVVVLLSTLLYLIFIKITDPLLDLLKSLMPEMHQEQRDLVYDRIIYHLDDFHPDRIPIPFKDIMIFGTYKQKRMAIEKMLRYYRPEFAPALKQGLEDKSNAVKVQAATAISFIDHKLFDENIKLKNLAMENPDDFELLKMYAENSMRYAFAEILDPDRKDKMLQSSLDAYEKYIEKCPHDLPALLATAKISFALNQLTKTTNTLYELLEKQFSPEAALLLMETLYKLGKLDELRLFAKELEKKIDEHPAHDLLQEQVSLWNQNK